MSLFLLFVGWVRFGGEEVGKGERWGIGSGGGEWESEKTSLAGVAAILLSERCIIFGLEHSAYLGAFFALLLPVYLNLEFAEYRIWSWEFSCLF